MDLTNVPGGRLYMMLGRADTRLKVEIESELDRRQAQVDRRYGRRRRRRSPNLMAMVYLAAMKKLEKELEN